MPSITGFPLWNPPLTVAGTLPKPALVLDNCEARLRSNRCEAGTVLLWAIVACRMAAITVDSLITCDTLVAITFYPLH